MEKAENKVITRDCMFKSLREGKTVSSLSNPNRLFYVIGGELKQVTRGVISNYLFRDRDLITDKWLIIEQ